jgi:hypothetical protein
MTANGRNTLWYGFGAGSSIVATACIASVKGDASERGNDALSLALVFFGYGLAAAFFYNLHRGIFLWRKSQKNESVAHWLPLGSGLLFGPIVFLIAHAGLRFGLDAEKWLWLIFVAPASIGFKTVRIGIKQNDN